MPHKQRKAHKLQQQQQTSAAAVQSVPAEMHSAADTNVYAEAAHKQRVWVRLYAIQTVAQQALDDGRHCNLSQSAATQINRVQSDSAASAGLLLV